MDHAQLVHEQWTHAALTGMQLFIKRVATDDNIADLPSRLVSSSPILVFVKVSSRHVYFSAGVPNAAAHGGDRSCTSAAGCVQALYYMGGAARTLADVVSVTSVARDVIHFGTVSKLLQQPYMLGLQRDSSSA